MPKKDQRENQQCMEKFVESGMEERLKNLIKDTSEDVKKTVTAEIAHVREEMVEIKREMRQDFQNITDRFENELEEVRREAKKERNELKAEIEKLSYHQRKYNLIFRGLKPKADVGNSCEEAVLDLCKQKLGINRSIQIVNAHKMGKNGEMVIARFVRWEDRCEILFSAKKLKDSGMSVQSDLPDALRKKRSELASEARQLCENGDIARVVERSNNVVLQIKRDGRWTNK